MRNCPSVPPFSGDQTAANGGDSPDNAVPNTFVAVVFARRMQPLALTSKAGHAALSKPNTTSGFTIQQQSTAAYNSFMKIQGTVTMPFHAVNSLTFSDHHCPR
jgi:hypothetical protein